MKHKVLLVDDEESLLAGLKRALRSEPYELLTANSPEEALALLEQQEVAVVVSDHNMPGMTGTAFLTQVSKLYPDTVRFILTGHASLEVALRAINEGRISRFFMKPCHTVDLATTIRQAIEHRELLAEARQLRKENKRQSTVINTLEDSYPGITSVQRDEEGSIVFEDAGDDLADLIRKLES